MIPGRAKPSGPHLEQHITPRARATSPRRRAWGRAAVPCTVGRRNGRDPDTLCARPMAECSLQPVAMAICRPGRCRYSQVRNVQPRSRVSTEVGTNRRFYAVNVCTSGSLVAAAPRNAVADPDQRGWLTNVRFNRELSLRAQTTPPCSHSTPTLLSGYQLETQNLRRHIRGRRSGAREQRQCSQRTASASLIRPPPQSRLPAHHAKCLPSLPLLPQPRRGLSTATRGRARCQQLGER